MRECTWVPMAWAWLVCLAGFVAADGSVLLIPSTLDPMHAQTMGVLADELARRGHRVTWLEIAPTQSKTVLAKNVSREFWPAQFGDRNLNDIYVHRNHSIYDKLWDADFTWHNEQTTGWLASIRTCDSVLTRNRAKFDRLVEQTFDTVIVDDLYNPCGLLLVALKKSVFIYWSLTSMRTESAWANQSPSPPSYLPVAGTGLSDELNFGQRIFNVASYLKQLYLHQHIVQTRVDALFQKHYPGVASAFDVERNASINFVNNPPIFDFARPFMPRVNFVGGLHCREAQPIPQDLEAFVQGGDGFVLLTTGFTAHWNRAPEHVKEMYVTTFATRRNLRFIWQYNGPEISKLPSNVVVRSFLPQQDLLGHKRCLAHVSHGGLNSVIESVWHGVPVVGMPLTSRGYDNLLRVTARGAGVMIEKAHFSAIALIDAIDTVIADPRYKEEVKVFQDMVTDVPFSELYHAAFWVEFIERHQEVPHARSGADTLNVLQYFLVDVMAFIISLIVCFSYLTYRILRTTLRLTVALFSTVFSGNSEKSRKKRPQKASNAKKTN